MSPPTSKAGSGLPDRLHALLEPVVAGAGFDLEAVRVTQMGRRRNVEVVVDRDGGVSMDAVAEAARVVSDALDAEEAAAVLGEQEYLLEVSSPGTDRPLTLPRHWRRAVTRLVNVKLHDGSELVGRVLDSDETGVLLEVNVKPPKPGMRTDKVEEKRFEFASIAKARVEIEFNRKGEEELDDADDAAGAEEEFGEEFDSEDEFEEDDEDDDEPAEADPTVSDSEKER
jgi:ribosome maturation factor RimP